MGETLFESVADLKQLLGRRVAVTDYVEVGQQTIDAFAEATGDRQWIHVDPERAARESPYGTTIAHGFLTLSLFSTLLNSTIRIKGVRLGVNYGLNYVRFLSPVAAGASIRAHFTLKAWNDAEAVGDATWEVMVEMRGSPKPACLGEWIVRYHF